MPRYPQSLAVKRSKLSLGKDLNNSRHFDIDCECSEAEFVDDNEEKLENSWIFLRNTKEYKDIVKLYEEYPDKFNQFWKAMVRKILRKNDSKFSEEIKIKYSYEALVQLVNEDDLNIQDILKQNNLTNCMKNESILISMIDIEEFEFR